MKTFLMIAVIGVFFTACKKDHLQMQDELNENEQIKIGRFHLPDASPSDPIQVPVAVPSQPGGGGEGSGTGIYSPPGECSPKMNGAVYSIRMSGEMEGCLDVYVDNFGCSPAGTYREAGREHFSGTYAGIVGSFWTRYKFESRSIPCPSSGPALGYKVFGDAQHTLVQGSGTGVFKNGTGLIKFKDGGNNRVVTYNSRFKF